MYNRTTPLVAVHLGGRANSQPNVGATKQRSVGVGVDAKVEVQVGAVLVRARQAGLRAERVARSRAQVGDHDDDTVAVVGDLVTAAVGLEGELPACSAAWTGTSALRRRVSRSR